MADPITLMGASMAMTAIGGGISAAGTLASGSAAETAGQMKQAAAYRQAEQETWNAAGELGASQRKMLDTRLKTNLTESTLAARGAASGFDASKGSMLTGAGDIAQRGEFQALMDVFNGENARTGMLNKADAIRAGGDADAWAGEATKDASYLSAAGTIAGSAGSMMKTYGQYTYPQAGKAYG
ncbi:hypothetical protein [Bradyrhizobium sp. 188]|uniref:hypothetical protein n=1 Tax=Bradyrhizobium sp. 188 TaxID=2782656 RepID=UPI001FFB7A4E|nr:hypothetical protein [Bradyrhizobium sp. 188]MCK1501504.1 hypothetical protein [Bradyrhizobium sp. 188]